MTDLLQLNDIYKWVGRGPGKTEILKGISMRVQQGEFIALMGASGSGKSTLLNLIGLLDTPSAGTLHLLGHPVSKFSEDRLAEVRNRRIGFIFQNFNLLELSHRSPKTFVSPMEYAQRPDTRERAMSLLERVGLSHRINAYPSTLSGGEKQRVAIARALANNPAFLLADEPTGALDSKTGTQIMSFLRELNQQGTTILMVTHDEKIAQQAQRTLMMKDGRFE